MIEKLLQGSYKGVQFIAGGFSTSGGRKTVVHSFPNSDKQVIEDLGLQPRSYSMTIFLSDKDGRYFINRDRILSRLEDGKSGKLVHPIYGDIENVKVGSITTNENLTELGDGKISVIFQVSDGTGIPEKALNSLSVISKTTLVATIAIRASFTENYQTSIKAPNSYADSLSKLNDAVDSFKSISKTVQAAADKINDFTSQLNAFENNITSLIRTPLELATSIDNLFSTIGNLYPTVEATARVMLGFFAFGDSDTTLSPTTPSRIERALNRKILNDTMQSTALTYAYLNSSQMIFNTVDEIEQQAEELETQYQKLFASGGLDDTSKSALNDARISVQEYFEQQKLTANQIITVETNPLPARIIAFQYYGSPDNGEQIAALNESSEPSFLQGTIKVFSV